MSDPRKLLAVNAAIKATGLDLVVMSDRAAAELLDRSRPTITIEVRSVYGKQLVYPVCEKAKHFARIAGTLTFSHDNLCMIEALGFIIEHKRPPNRWGKAAIAATGADL